uniref:BAR domain-containing protein n=1 Tax=Angiostrongylus cantonensis TaxID=6313 RepID=A0A0K0DCS1_ANGCA
MTIKVQRELDELATIFEKTHPMLPNIEDEFAQYSSAVEEAIGNIFEYLVHSLYLTLSLLSLTARLFEIMVPTKGSDQGEQVLAGESARFNAAEPHRREVWDY